MKPLNRYCFLRVLILVCAFIGSLPSWAAVTDLSAANEPNATTPIPNYKDPAHFGGQMPRVIPGSLEYLSIGKHDAAAVTFIVVSGALFFAAAQMAKRHIAIRIISFFVGIACMLAIAIVRERRFPIKIPILPDGTAPATFGQYFELALPIVILTIAMSFVWKLILSRWWTGGASRKVRPPGMRRNWRPLAIGFLILAPILAIIRFAYVETWFRQTYAPRTLQYPSTSLWRDLADISWRNNMVTVQASLDIAVVLLAVLGFLILWWTRKRSSRPSHPNAH